MITDISGRLCYFQEAINKKTSKFINSVIIVSDIALKDYKIIFSGNCSIVGTDFKLP
jgi:Icc-related predicted phosphoesterase